MNSEQQIERYGKKRELFFIESCDLFSSHIAGVYSDGKITSAFIRRVDRLTIIE